MRETFGGIVVVAVVIGAINSSWNSRKPSTNPVKFNEAVVNSAKNNKLIEAYTRFLTRAYQAAQTGGDLTELLQARDAVLACQDEMLADMNTVQVPDAQTARNFYQASWTMRQNQTQAVKTAVTEIVQLLTDSSLAAPVKKARIQEAWHRAVTRENIDMQAVRTTQEAFAREHHLTLLPPATR